MFQPFVDFFTDPTILLTLKILYYASYVIVPYFLLHIVWDLWVKWRRGMYWATLEFVLLEIKLPKEIFKSPRAMEFCIAALYQTSGEKNWFEKFWQGKTRAESSLEIVSIDGAVHFFIRVRKGLKNVVEANLYSQYPGIEIYDVPDYTIPYVYDPATMGLWGTEFEFVKGGAAFPIKTYIDYGLDKDPKEEYKIDPMTPLIEFLGGMQRGSQVWIQLVIRSHKAEEKDAKRTIGKWKIWKSFAIKDIWEFMEKKDYVWKENAQEEIDKIIAGIKGEKDKEGKLIPGTGRQLTEIEKETISALSRSISKNGFDVGIRAVYTAPLEIFSPNNFGGIIGGITHFNSHLNGFKPWNGSEERYGHVLFYWMARSTKKRDAERREMVDAYKRRAYYYPPFKREKFLVLNAEELATMFHLPGGVSATPTFTRIESRKAEAPANLPV